MPEQRLRFLAATGRLLASSLDISETLEQLATSIVPRFADWCTVSVVDEDGSIRRVAAAHADPDRRAVLDEYLRAAPEELRGTVVAAALRSGKSFFQPEISPERLFHSVGGRHLRMIQELGCTGVIAVPLVARGVQIGVIALVMAETARRFEEIDHQLAIELGALTALAIDNSRRCAERIELLHQAEAATRARDEFLAMLGHELRNPLAPIVTAVELMKARGTPDRELEVIDRQTRHLGRLVDDLLDVGRIARGRVELQRQPLEISAVVGDGIEMTERLFEQRHQRLTVNVPEGLVVDGDRTRLAQVLANLLTNAATYTPQGGAIDITAGRAGARITICVRDTGIGISEAILPYVFDMFVQDRQPLDRSRGGLGLGLAIVKNLIEAHDGIVTARSAGVGQGSELEIDLPASSAPVRGVGSKIADAPRDGARVLVVDDNEDAAELLSEALERSGFVTRVAHDAQEALAVCADFDPFGAILDIGLPVVDGYELARMIRARPGGRAMHLIAVTGYGQASDRERASQAGFDRHLVKPVSIATIRALLDAALGASSGIPAAP